MTHRKKLIEVALPLEAINIASAKEKSIRHGLPIKFEPSSTRFRRNTGRLRARKRAACSGSEMRPRRVERPTFGFGGQIGRGQEPTQTGKDQ